MAKSNIPQEPTTKQTEAHLDDGRGIPQLSAKIYKLQDRDEMIAEQIIRCIEQIIKPAEQLKLDEKAIKSELTAEGFSFSELKKAAKAIWDLKAPEQRRQAQLFAEYASSAVYELVLERIVEAVVPPDDDRDPNTRDWIDDHEA